MKTYILGFNNKCYVSNYSIKFIDNELVVDNVLFSNKLDSAFVFFDRESAVQIAIYISRLYDFDIVIEEVIR